MSHVKLLLDENVSPAVAVRLGDDGFDVAHIRDRGMNGATDPEVMQKAFEEDRILVTANVRDFDMLARAAQLHPGVVLISDGALRRSEQERVVRAAITAIAAEHDAGRDMVNRTLTISLSGATQFATVPPGEA